MGVKQQIRNHTIEAFYFIIAGILIFTANAFSFQSPRQGRFLQRDPIETTNSPLTDVTEQNVFSAPFARLDLDPINQYADGMNLYQYVGSNPINWLDPQGYWIVDRNGAIKAMVEAEANDTINTLANKIGLNASLRQ